VKWMIKAGETVISSNWMIPSKWSPTNSVSSSKSEWISECQEDLMSHGRWLTDDRASTFECTGRVNWKKWLATSDNTVDNASLDHKITIYQTKWNCFMIAMPLRIKFFWFGRYSWFSKICDQLFEDFDFRNNCEFRSYPVLLIKVRYFEI
jgi:hypothetical protein